MPESRHTELDRLIDAVSKLRGRLHGLFAQVRAASDLTEMESTVLMAVEEAPHPPTVPQIGRSLGHPRQVIQRAANQLVERGLIAMRDNPDHKRASLLVATDAGKALRADARRRAAAISDRLMTALDAADVRRATALVTDIRLAIDAFGKDQSR